MSRARVGRGRQVTFAFAFGLAMLVAACARERVDVADFARADAGEVDPEPTLPDVPGVAPISDASSDAPRGCSPSPGAGPARCPHCAHGYVVPDDGGEGSCKCCP